MNLEARRLALRFAQAREDCDGKVDQGLRDAYWSLYGKDIIQALQSIQDEVCECIRQGQDYAIVDPRLLYLLDVDPLSFDHHCWKRFGLIVAIEARAFL